MNFNDRTNSFDKADIEKNKAISAISYFGILFFLPLVVCPTSAFGKFHANQALLILILGVVSAIAGVIPFIGGIIAWILDIAIFIAFLFGLINTLNGKAIELPFIGGIQIIK